MSAQMSTHRQMQNAQWEGRQTGKEIQNEIAVWEQRGQRQTANH